MNRRMILYLICQILRIEAVTMIPAAVIAIVQKEYPSLIGFIFAMLAMGGVSLLSAAFRVRKKEICPGWLPDRIISVDRRVSFWCASFLDQRGDSKFY